MELIIRPRQGGKTTELAQWVKEDREHRVILVPNDEQAHFMRRTYSWLNTDNVMTIGYWRTSGRGKRKIQIAFDNADMLLQSIAGPFEIVKVTWNKDA